MKPSGPGLLLLGRFSVIVFNFLTVDRSGSERLCVFKRT